MSTKMINDIVQKERQISIDPVSMKEIIDYPSSHGLPKPQTTKKQVHSIPKKNKFISASLPNSACSSPRGVHDHPSTKAKDYDHQTLERASPKYHQQHSLALSHLVWFPENHMQRSKSCGEGRPSVQYDEFDLTSIKSTSTISASAESTPRGQTQTQTTSEGGDYTRIVNAKKRNDDDFKCGVLCLFLPGFGKGKPVRSRRDQEQREESRHVISKRVSLEKFECGSWRTSSGIDFSSNLYFDLPLELIQTSGNDATLPVNSAFVFDKDVKGALKTKGGGELRNSNDRRHVRFSTSSSTSSPSNSCITPRMRKAREDFNSYLEAQNA